MKSLLKNLLLIFFSLSFAYLLAWGWDTYQDREETEEPEKKAKALSKCARSLA